MISYYIILSYILLNISLLLTNIHSRHSFIYQINFQLANNKAENTAAKRMVGMELSKEH